MSVIGNVAAKAGTHSWLEGKRFKWKGGSVSDVRFV